MVRILVTTRNENVAKIMQTTSYFSPNYLSENSSWQLFQHYAFSGTSDTISIHLVDIGREITRKCGGLPLAVKSIASLLGFEEANQEFWREILESDLWEIKESKEVIFPALQISYVHLPAHLKPCFLICSMYPKDYMLRNRELINLWIAHGYVESQSNRNIMEIGVDYYNELKKRSFLDVSYFSQYCKLHDIIHDLARLISENEHYSVEINQPLNIQKRTVLQEAYHLFVSGFFMEFDLQILQQNMKGLRTIFMDFENWYRAFEVKNCTNCTWPINLNSEVTEEVCQNCLKDITFRNLTKFEVLRVLILKWGSLTKVPHSIFELKHLTYLSISCANLVMLPLSIGLLYNLLALEVNCASLEYLPENIGDLANLQFLRIFYANLQKLPKSLCSLTNLLELALPSYEFLDYVPHGLVNFPSLTKVSAQWNVRTIGWLKDMKDLKGRISIGQLRNINNLEDAKRANLSNKCKLDKLDLCWNDLDGTDDLDNDPCLHLILEVRGEGIVGEDDVHFSLLECLQPHPNLKKLLVKEYPSAIVPEWMRDPFLLKSIQELKILCCDHIESLPFGNLHTLKSLHIEECSSIRTMQLEQLPSQLEKLWISSCRYLELITGVGHLDMLRTLAIEYCPSLHFLPDGLIPSGPCYVRVYGCSCPDFS